MCSTNLLDQCPQPLIVTPQASNLHSIREPTPFDQVECELEQ